MSRILQLSIQLLNGLLIILISPWSLHIIFICHGGLVLFYVTFQVLDLDRCVAEIWLCWHKLLNFLTVLLVHLLELTWKLRYRCVTLSKTFPQVFVLTGQVTEILVITTTSAAQLSLVVTYRSLELIDLSLKTVVLVLKIFQIWRTFTQKFLIIAFKLCQNSSQLFFFFPNCTQILFKIFQFLMILSINIFKSNPFFFMSPQSNSQSSNLSDSFLADIIAIWDKLINSFFELFILIIKSNYFLSMLTNFSAGLCISLFILFFGVIESMS